MKSYIKFDCFAENLVLLILMNFTGLHNKSYQLKKNGWSLSCYCLLIWIPFISFTAKSQELKKDIEILSQTFERVIDRKEAIIKSLVKDIEEAEEQYQMALRSHLQNVDRLIGKYITHVSNGYQVHGSSYHIIYNL